MKLLTIQFFLILNSISLIGQISESYKLIDEVNKIKPNIDSIASWVNEGENLNASYPDDNETALIKSVIGKHYKIAKLLLKSGADPSLEDYHAGPLYWAVGAEYYKMVKLLLDYGVFIDSQTASQYTPLYRAVEKNNEKIAKLLIKRGANVNMCDHNRVSPLMIAAQNNNIHIVKMLINAGVDINITNCYGATALSFALDKANSKMLRLLGKKEDQK